MYLGKWIVTDLSVAYQTTVSELENRRTHLKIPCVYVTLLGKC